MGMTVDGLGETNVRDAERRWAHWIARGAARDRSTQRLAIGVVAAGACGFAVWIAILLRG